MPRGATFTGLIVITLLVRGGVLLFAPGALVADPDGYRGLAEHLLERGSLGHAGVPTAYRPPLYPLLLTVAVAMGDSSRAAIGLLHLVLGVATVSIVWHLGRRLGLGDYALLAALLVACDPILLGQSTLVMSETLATFLAVVSLFALTAAAERPSAVRVIAAGACLGLAALCRPTFLVWAAAAGVVLPALADSRPARLRVLASFAAGLAAVLAPWAVRNQVQFGRPILATTHGGYTLLLGNNPSFYDYVGRGAWGSVWNAHVFIEDWAERLRRREPADELESDRMAYAEAWQNIRSRPAAFCRACLVRVGRFWAPLPHQATGAVARGQAVRYAVGFWYIVELALAAVGAAAIFRGFAGRRSGHTVWIWGLLLVLSFTAVHTVYWTNMRMRAPLMPVVALAAAVGTAFILARVVGRKSYSSSDLRL